MTKSDYIANSAKYFAVGCLLLFAANLLQLLKDVIPQFSQQFAALSNSVPQLLAAFLFPMIAFLALNGEGVGYRKASLPAEKKRTVHMKRLLLLLFLLTFFRNAVSVAAQKADSGFWGILLCVFSALFASIATYASFLIVVVLYCRRRDRAEKKLAAVQTAVLAISLVYFAGKLMSNLLAAFPAGTFPAFFTELFSRKTGMSVFCLVLYLAQTGMFFFVRNRYQILSGQEEELESHRRAVGITACDLYADSGRGMDTADDDVYFAQVDEGEATRQLSGDESGKPAEEPFTE